MKRSPLLALSALTALLLSSCAAPSEETAAGGEDGGTLSVLASFYPLQYVTERVGGEQVRVESMTPAGAEPHDLELSPAAVDRVRTADAVVYLSGFQPAVDDAVAQAAPEHALDAAHAGIEGEAAHAAEEHAAAEEDHSAEAHEASGAEESHAGEDGADGGHGHGAQDPHFWLDPQRLAAVAVEVAHELGEADPDNAALYERNAEELTGELEALDQEFSSGLETCERRTVVVAHEAYGYLTDAYDLEQVSVAGLEPDTEPSPARLAEIGKVVEEEGVTTVFAESEVDTGVAEALAAEHGVETAVLDPVETQADESADYQQVMRANLGALRAALGC
ncbi:metal ABC transporter substrate-binding protein [Kocuria sp. LUK]|uniref:metal ABC transporter substrate-binding protein n=1 Tax=Kocuria sp. LUK TaxID=2897828 RepID=UPI001E5325D4|nr:metal ABC transporter substrate-binding protein [Kocuria sp. LUK]MCD1144523.1 metal ABC transporter substrate-binding protein [Kocuria sp. LUK]